MRTWLPEHRKIVSLRMDIAGEFVSKQVSRRGCAAQGAERGEEGEGMGRQKRERFVKRSGGGCGR